VRNIFTGSHIEHCWRCPQKLALKLKAKEREKEIQQDMQNNKQNISSRKNSCYLGTGPSDPQGLYLVIELQNGKAFLALFCYK
jgi:hypothetical protein